MTTKKKKARVWDPNLPILAQSIEDCQPLLNRLRDPTTKLVCYDAETDGLDYKTCVVVGHVITLDETPNGTWYVPVRHQWDRGAEAIGNVAPIMPDPREFRLFHPFEIDLRAITKTRRDLHWFGHNFIFDLMMNRNHNLVITGTVECTQVDAALLNEFQTSYSLEACCVAMGTTPKKGDELYRHLANTFGGESGRQQMGNYWKLPGNDPIGVDYACGDGTATWDLYQRQCADLRHIDMDHIRQLESDVTRVVYRMMSRGVICNRRRVAEVMEIVEDKLVEANKKLPTDFNPRAPSQVKAYLTAAGNTDWPLLPPTPAALKKALEKGTEAKGNPSFSEKWLKTHDAGRAILTSRKYSHLKNSFLVPLLERHIWPDGRVRPTFHQCRADDFGVVTYRFSCSDPNLQQAHKRNEELGRLIRSCYEPEEDEEWLDADLSQCEPRLLTHYTGAKALMEGYLSDPPVDAHQAVATAANIDRESGKRLNQTLITGGGRAKIVSMLGAEGNRIYEQYFKALPEIKTFQKKAARKFEMRGYMISLLGRRSRLESRDKSYKAINRLLQVGNADIIKQAMVRIDRLYEEDGDKLKLLNTVHDSLSSSVPKDDHSRKVAMEGLKMFADYGPGRFVDMRVPMAVEFAFGSDWAVATFDKSLRQMMGALVTDINWQTAALDDMVEDDEE